MRSAEGKPEFRNDECAPPLETGEPSEGRDDVADEDDSRRLGTRRPIAGGAPVFRTQLNALLGSSNEIDLSPRRIISRDMLENILNVATVSNSETAFGCVSAFAARSLVMILIRETA